MNQHMNSAPKGDMVKLTLHRWMGDQWEVDALPVGDLFVCEVVGHRWEVAHYCGMTVACDLPDRASAVACAEALADVFDWTLPPGSLRSRSDEAVIHQRIDDISRQFGGGTLEPATNETIATVAARNTRPQPYEIEGSPHVES